MITKKRGIVFVSLFLFLIFVGLSLAIDGCYYYPGSSLYCTKVSDTAALADYSGYLTYFSPGKECSTITTCKQVLCTATCDYLTKGECDEKDGKEIDETTVLFNDWCAPGCCNVGTYCDYVTTKHDCVDKAIKQGLTETSISSWITTKIDSAMTPTKCKTVTCSMTIKPATLKGYILDSSGTGISGVTVEIAGQTTKSLSDGSYSIASINPGTYLIRVSMTGYISISKSLSLGIDETKELNFTLSKSIESATLSGTVKDKSGNPLSATVSWTGPTSGYVLTDSNGAYKAEGLTLNKEYTITVSSYGYTTKIEKITPSSSSVTKNFELETSKLQGINGYVYIDKNGDGTGTEDEKVYGANIYIDSVFKTSSQYSKLGFYEISLSAGTYKISASYQTYKLKQPISFTITSGITKTQDLILTKYIGECSYGTKDQQKDVSGFSANHVLGKEEVSLKWIKPCPEVTSYQITKYDSTGKKIDFWTESPAKFSYTDSKVEWGKSYSYEIVAVYTDVRTRYSKNPAKVSITLGDEDCEGKYDSITGWKTFCLIGSTKTDRQTVWTCDNQNKKGIAKDCSKSDSTGHSYYCSEISETSAICKDSGMCGMALQSADPFGMYYDRQTCYGVTNPIKTSPANFCYYDYTDTVVDECNSCADIDSCFKYKGKDACEINNCLGTECKWIDSADGISIYKGYENILSLPILEETGHGYCAEKDYKKDDKCDLCGPKSPPSTLFENYYCTANVCSNLGKCFSKADLSTCLSCGDKPTEDNNCYAYGTEKECTNGQPLTNNLGEIILSKDRCGWGRCVWKGTDKFDEHGCVKDGDGNGKEDCTGFGIAEQKLCKIDNKAPETKLVPEGIKIISFANPELTFQGTDDDNEMGVLGYCLGNADATATKCTDFKEISYPGKLNTEKIKLDVANSVLKGKVISGTTYRLRYYSKDKYFNQENVKEEFVFVDTEIPLYEIKSINVTSLDKTDLEVYLTGLNELMECTFELKPILPIGTTKTDKILRTVTDKKVSYEDLTGVIYDMNVSCEDDYGNQNNKSKRFIFDLEPDIDVIYPKGPISKTKIIFDVKTTIGSTCELYTVNANQKIADFVTDSVGKTHKTKEISGFIEGDYKGTHKVVCKDLLTQKIKTDYFDFQVDFTGPKTQIILTENKREEKPTNYGWEENFVKEVNVSFKCSADGFACKKTNYCLGNGCEYITSTGYKEYTASIELSNDTDICYYSIDVGTNDESPICGKIIVDGFGITLVRPKEYSYQGEKWGVSNTPTFDLKLMTKVPTTDCRFDFLDNFNFNGVAPYKIFSKEGTYYAFNGFPGNIISPYSKNGGVKTIYVKCNDSNNEIGPAQKFNLEYDNSAPTIKKAYANPDKIYDGIETNIYVITDDKTICRFDEGKAEFGTMKYSFPGIETNILNTNHQTKFKISFSGTKKIYKMSAQCKNGAGNLSEIKNFTFTVDYTKKGNIVSTKPSGYIDGKSVTLEVVTNKNSQCKYNTTTLITTDGKTHKHSLGTLTEGKYAYLIRCLIDGENREAKIAFVVDTTAPQITSINDGSYSCSLKSTPKTYVYTDEENVTSYYYELYSSSSSNSTSSGSLVKSGTIPAKVPFKVDVNLNENETYYFKIKVGDAAGNWGTIKTSDGFTAVSNSYDSCKTDTTPPTVTYSTNESCSMTNAEMQCYDDTNCDTFYYGKGYDSTSCDADSTYNGQKISFSQTGWLCYYVEDTKGNNKTGMKKIEFDDADGDGVSDTCDKCANTASGKVVDNTGCAIGQSDKTLDTDSDGLPDYWENLYDEDGCELDYTNKDSNTDGTTDDKEDYDNDTYTNYEEYNSGYDPCVSDAPEKTDVDQVTIITASGEVSVLALTLLICGLLLVIGGIGYLIYYNKFKGKAPSFQLRPASRPAIQKRRIARPLTWKERILGLRKTRAQREKLRKRKALFGVFSKESKSIPHIEPLLKTRVSPVRRIEQLANRYSKKKHIIKPGLKSGEKGIFSKLEAIANKTKKEKVEDVVSDKEAKNIFDKLKKISEKRKK